MRARWSYLGVLAGTIGEPDDTVLVKGAGFAV
jgi:hypothetical protein